MPARITTGLSPSSPAFAAAANFPRYYVVSTKHSLPYAVVDRFGQSAGIDFMAGKFDRKAVKCRFADRQDAAEWCAERIGRAKN